MATSVGQLEIDWQRFVRGSRDAAARVVQELAPVIEELVADITGKNLKISKVHVSTNVDVVADVDHESGAYMLKMYPVSVDFGGLGVVVATLSLPVIAAMDPERLVEAIAAAIAYRAGKPFASLWELHSYVKKQLNKPCSDGVAIVEHARQAIEAARMWARSVGIYVPTDTPWPRDVVRMLEDARRLGLLVG